MQRKLSKTVLIPCTTWPSKFWSQEYWIELITRLIDEYQTQIYITGILPEKAYIEEIMFCLKPSYKKKVEVVLNKGLTALRYMYASVDLVIGVDTGPLHLAADALQNKNSRVLGLYGPTAGSRTGPYGFDYISYDEISGEPACHKRTLEEDGASMLNITPLMVMEKLDGYGFYKA